MLESKTLQDKPRSRRGSPAWTTSTFRHRKQPEDRRWHQKQRRRGARPGICFTCCSPFRDDISSRTFDCSNARTRSPYPIAQILNRCTTVRSGATFAGLSCLAIRQRLRRWAPFPSTRRLGMAELISYLSPRLPSRWPRKSGRVLKLMALREGREGLLRSKVGRAILVGRSG